MDRYTKLVRSFCSMLKEPEFNDTMFCRVMTRESNREQEMFTKLCAEWLLICGSYNYHYNRDNEKSRAIGLEVRDALKSNKIVMY